MSLINDAWKEAQRQRDAQRTPGKPAVLGEDFFPEPPRAKRQNRSKVVAASVGLIALSAVVIALTIHVALRSASPPDSATAPTTAANTRTAMAGATRGTVAEAAPSPISVPPSENTRAEAPAAPGEDRTEQNDRPTVGRREESASAKSSSTAPAVAGRSQASAGISPTPRQSDRSSQIPAVPEKSESNGVRVIIDPVTLRAGDSLFARAYAEQTRGNLDGAAELYERALLNPPVSPELYNDYGALLATRDKHAAAIAMYNRGIAANDKDARLWMNLGDSYRAVGRRADAMSAYFAAAKLDPSNIAVRIRLAAEYATLGDTANARRGFEEAVRAAPNDAEVRYRYGAFLLDQHDTRGAIRELDRFVELAPGKYSNDVVERTRTFVGNLRRQAP